MMRRRTESIPEITFDGDFHFGQTDHVMTKIYSFNNKNDFVFFTL